MSVCQISTGQSQKEACRVSRTESQMQYHRYLSREEILNKVTQEKKKHFKEQRAREHLESEMLHMDRDDHTDLLTMMSTIDKNDVPEDLSIIWEQQSKILATESSHGYRWHPK